MHTRKPIAVRLNFSGGSGDLAAHRHHHHHHVKIKTCLREKKSNESNETESSLGLRGIRERRRT